MNAVGMQVVMIVALFAIMYFLLIRPQKKREKQIAEMRSSVKVGDDILTIGGIYAKVVKVKDDKLTIQVGADKVKFDIAKWAVSKVENAAPGGSKKKTVDDIEAEEEKPQKVSPKKMKKLGAASEAAADEAVEVPAEVVSEEPEAMVTEPVAEAPVEEEPIR